MTVVIPAHNAERTIGIAVSSVLSQTHERVEVIVVDDGSQDTTATIVAAYPDPRIKLIQQPQSGASAARNAGLRAANGEIVAFLDDDDYWMPSYLEAALRLMRPGKWFVTANAYYMYSGGISPRMLVHNGKLPKPGAQRSTLLRSNWVSIMSVFPIEMLQDVGEFDETLHRAEDWDFWLRAVFAGWHVVHQPRPLAIFDRTQISQSSALEEVATAEGRIVEKMLVRPDLTPEERGYLERRTAEPHAGLLVHLTNTAIDAGNYRDAAEYAKRAARISGRSSPQRLKAAGLNLAPTVVGPLLRTRHERRALAGLTAPEVPGPDGERRT